MELFFSDFLHNLWQLLGTISVYILFGLLFAGILKQLIPEDFIKRQLGEHSIKAITKASLWGIPLPLCSCSVIPFAQALKKDGASSSALQTFLIATPITGADSIFATYGAFGWFFTLYRLVSSVVISFLAGVLSMLFHQNEPKNTPSTMQFFAQKPSVSEETSCSVATSCCGTTPKAPFLSRVFSYAFVTLFKDIAKPLFIGLLLAALITTLIPEKMDNFLTSNLLLSYLFVLLISMPLYVCATSSIPLGISLVLTGFSPGAAFVFLTAGPATNMITISIVKKMLGTKGMWIYLSSVVLGSLFFAFIMDLFFSDALLGMVAMVHEEESLTLLEAIASTALLLLGFKTLKPQKKEASSGCGCH